MGWRDTGEREEGMEIPVADGSPGFYSCSSGGSDGVRSTGGAVGGGGRHRRLIPERRK